MSCDVCARSSCTACSTPGPAGGGRGERGDLEQLVDRGRFRRLLGEAVSLLQRQGLVGGNPVDETIEVAPQPRIHPRAVGRVEQDVERLVEGGACLFEVPERQLPLAKAEEAIRFGEQGRRRVDRRHGSGGRDRRRGGGGLNRRRDLRCRVAAACRRYQEDCNGQPERSSHLGAPLPDRSAPMCLRPAGGSYRGVGAGQVLPAGRNLRTKLGSGKPDRNPSPWIEIRPSGGPAEGSTPRGVRSRRRRDVFSGATRPRTGRSSRRVPERLGSRSPGLPDGCAGPPAGPAARRLRRRNRQLARRSPPRPRGRGRRW